MALIYRIEHSDSVDYGHANPLDVEDSRLRLRVEDRRARFELKVHFAMVERAREVIAHYIRVWEFDSKRHGCQPVPTPLETTTRPDGQAWFNGRVESQSREIATTEFNSARGIPEHHT